MNRREKGFTFVELLIVMVLFGLVLAATSEMFIGMLRGYKSQSKMAESNIEGIIGLEMLRRDIESAGYGSPWVIPSGTTYQEVTTANVFASAFNDAPSNPPRAILSEDDIAASVTGIVTHSDCLVIKATILTSDAASTRWHYLLTKTVPAANRVPLWSGEVLATVQNDRVIIISPGSPDQETLNRTLVSPSGNNMGTSVLHSGANALASDDENQIVYGVDPATTLRMPFNRADYYVSTVGVPGRCAPGTGVLVKAVVKQSDGTFTDNIFPLLDCVADMQISYRLDRLVDGNISTTTVLKDGGGAELTAAQIRDQLKEVRVSILTHEGQKDTNYTYPASTIYVGEASLGRTFDFTIASITNWQNYRWKLYTLVAKPNLR